MAAPCVAPQVEPSVETKTPKVQESQPIRTKESGRNLLAEIFQGHDEFLGLTPD